MTITSFHQSHFGNIMSFTIISLMLLLQGCSKLPQPNHTELQSTEPDSESAGACIEVHGKVLGDVIPNSKVFLYQIGSLNYSIVMGTIRKGHPSRWNYVNESRGFIFDCLSFGKYSFVIQTASYKSKVGSPLPYEFDCPNVSIRIAFQGGDHKYSVGAFSIEKPLSRSDSDCNDNPFLCRTIRGSLYRRCPMEGK
jgi:hypothetical protein